MVHVYRNVHLVGVITVQVDTQVHGMDNFKNKHTSLFFTPHHHSHTECEKRVAINFDSYWLLFWERGMCVRNSDG
jgi:hypothetical protein